MMKRHLTPLSLTLVMGVATCSFFSSSVISPVLASRLDNGRVVFDSPLELIELTPLLSESGSTRYRLVIQIPPSAGESMEALVIAPRRRQASIAFDLQATEAFLSRANNEVQAIPLASIGGNPVDLNQVLVVFEQPVLPGNQVTVVLTALPSTSSSIHELGVTAYPAGEDSIGQVLGYTEITD